MQNLLFAAEPGGIIRTALCNLHKLTTKEDGTCHNCARELDCWQAVTVEWVYEGKRINVSVCAPCWDKGVRLEAIANERSGFIIKVQFMDGREFC